jgi:dihydrofolate reductase
MSRLSLIWAMGENRVIGVDNRLPWHLPADLRHFRQLTTGHPIFMGRKTFESFPKPLPDRLHVVITSNTSYRVPPGCICVPSIDAALTATRDAPEVFVIGGASLYAQMLPRAHRLYVTLIHGVFAGDTRFPDFNWGNWREIQREEYEADEQNRYAYSFLTLDRIRATDTESGDLGSKLGRLLLL